MRIGDKVKIVKAKEYSDSSVVGEEGILGRYDEGEGEPDLVYLDIGECEFLKFIEVELIPTTMNVIEEFV